MDATGVERHEYRRWVSAAGLGICLAVSAGILLRTFVISAVRVPSGSMEDTILPGDHVLVNKLVAPRPLLVQFPFAPPSPIVLHIPAVRSIRLGDVLVIRPPAGVLHGLPPRDVYLLKRCVGTPGDTLRFSGATLSVNGKAVMFPPSAKQERAPHLLTETAAPVSVIVPPGSYYVMGDNPGDSEDSRAWGPVPYASIVGSAAMIYWSVAPPSPDRSAASRKATVRWNRIGVLIR